MRVSDESETEMREVRANEICGGTKYWGGVATALNSGGTN